MLSGEGEFVAADAEGPLRLAVAEGSRGRVAVDVGEDIDGCVGEVEHAVGVAGERGDERVVSRTEHVLIPVADEELVELVHETAALLLRGLTFGGLVNGQIGEDLAAEGQTSTLTVDEQIVDVERVVGDLDGLDEGAECGDVIGQVQLKELR